MNNDIKDILEKNNNKDIQKIIKEDILRECPEIKNVELEHFCNNLYVYSILKVYNIEKKEIVKQIMYQNQKFNEKLEKENIELSKDSLNIYLNFLENINDKYEKIIKERI